MGYERAVLIAAHKRSINHRRELEASAVCGCFYCGKTCAAEVEDWVEDEGGTALCPHCGVDSVIGSASGYPVGDPQFLAAMFSHWFTGI